MKALVTGAAGFIGSHLVELLNAEGENVRCFVKMENDDVAFIKRICSDIVYGDIRDIESLKKATTGIDIVYHLAAISRFNATIPHKEYIAVNIDGTRNVLDASRLAGVKRVVYVSSIEAVGLSTDGKPLNEKTEPRPISIYGETKLGGEKVALEYYKNYGMDVVIVRPPSVYGPRNLLHLHRLFKLVSRGYYPVIGDGKALIEFCYVKNQVYGIKLAGEKGKAGEIYFISDERSYYFEEVVKEIANQLGVNLKIFHIPVCVAWGIGLFFELLSKIFRFPPITVKETGRAAFSRRSLAWLAKSSVFCDISKAKEELGYQPPYSLRDGIRETIKWYRTIGEL